MAHPCKNSPIPTREQKQMIMTQIASLERTKIQASLFAILGQDYKTIFNQGLWDRNRSGPRSGKGRGYYTHVESIYDDGYYLGEDHEVEEFDFDSYEDDGIYNQYDEESDEWYQDDFDTDQVYYQDDEA